MARVVGLNERGLRVGEGHPRAKLTDHDVDLIRQLAEVGISLGQIAMKFDTSKTNVWNIVHCRSRWQVPETYRTIQEERRRGED